MPSTHKFRKGFKKFADEKSIELRKALGLRPTHPLPARKLAEHLGAKIVHPRDIPTLDHTSLKHLLKGPESGWSGVAIQVESIPILIINDSHSLARQESTIMHELSHIILEHSMGEFKTFDGSILLRSFNSQHEGEADWLGGCLQLPRVALYYAHKDGLTITEIAEKFCASQDMVRFRMNMCGVVRRR